MSPDDSTPAPRLITATVHGRYVARPPARLEPHRWFVGFHGYAQEAIGFFECLSGVPGADAWLVASIQALHPFYASRSQQIVANWMTRQDRLEAIADNVAYVDRVLDALEAEFGAPRCLAFTGFSQGVAMAYRAAMLGRRAADGVIAVGGDVPPELDGSGRAWPRVRIIAGETDHAYTAGRVDADFARLHAMGASVEVTRFAGGHEWATEVSAAAGRALAEIGREGALG